MTYQFQIGDVVCFKDDIEKSIPTGRGPITWIGPVEKFSWGESRRVKFRIEQHVYGNSENLTDEQADDARRAGKIVRETIWETSDFDLVLVATAKTAGTIHALNDAGRSVAERAA